MNKIVIAGGTGQVGTILAEHSSMGKRMGLAQGWRGRIFTLVVITVPAFGLFPPPFVLNVMIPFFRIIGALP